MASWNQLHRCARAVEQGQQTLMTDIRPVVGRVFLKLFVQVPVVVTAQQFVTLCRLNRLQRRLVKEHDYSLPRRVPLGICFWYLWRQGPINLFLPG